VNTQKSTKTECLFCYDFNNKKARLFRRALK
jgi:hypothetical protein